jgi:hypothetical protein
VTKEKKMAEGTWVENRPKKPPPIKPSDENNSTVTVPRPSTSGLQGARTPTLSFKRQRSEDSTPVSDQRKPAKRARSEDRIEYRDALCIKMAVIREGFPNEAFTEQDLDDLQLELLNRMEGLPPRTGPTFKTYKLEDGAIIIICMEEPSRNWLQKTIGEMNPWNNMVMKVGAAKELIWTSKIIMKLPKIYNGLRAENIQKKMETQNAGLQSQKWTILNRKVELMGQTIVFQVKEQDAEILRGQGYTIFFGLCQIQMKALDKPKTSHGNGQIGASQSTTQLCGHGQPQ